MESEQPIYPELDFDGSFRFSCGPHISCFVDCCTGTNIWLYPFDVLRISRALGISTTEFIRRHCRYFDSPPHFPVLLLKSADNGKGRCPFALDSGCSVYPDRPWVCRLFPVVPTECRTDETAECDRRFNIFVWKGCRGVGTGPETTIREWWLNAGMAVYEETYLDWQKLTEELKLSGQLTGEKAEMFSLGSFDPDRLLHNLRSNEYADIFPLEAEKLHRAADDDIFLMQLACRWLRRVLLDKELPENI